MANYAEIVLKARDETGGVLQGAKSNMMRFNADLRQWSRVAWTGISAVAVKAFVEAAVAHSAFAGQVKSEWNLMSAQWYTTLGMMGNRIGETVDIGIKLFTKLGRVITDAFTVKAPPPPGGKEGVWSWVTRNLSEGSAFLGAMTAGTGETTESAMKVATGTTDQLVKDQAAADAKLKQEMNEYAKWRKFKQGELRDQELANFEKWAGIRWDALEGENKFYDDSIEAFRSYQQMMVDLKRKANERYDVEKEPDYAQMEGQSKGDQEDRAFTSSMVTDPKARAKFFQSQRAQRRLERREQNAINNALRRQAAGQSLNFRDQEALRLNTMEKPADQQIVANLKTMLSHTKHLEAIKQMLGMK